MKSIKVSVSQFPVSDDIKKNIDYIEKQVVTAALEKAQVVHFPETSLSGYGHNIDRFEWEVLEHGVKKVRELAKKYSLYIILGTYFKENNEALPYNSTCVIDDKGHIEGWYHKRNLYGRENEWFSRGDSSFTTHIHGVKCGFLICYDSCFPHLFEDYQDEGVDILFISYYNANNDDGPNTIDSLMTSQIATRAADYGMHIVGSNSSKAYSRFAASIAYPDGKVESLPRHQTGILTRQVPTTELGWTYAHPKR